MTLELPSERIGWRLIALLMLFALVCRGGALWLRFDSLSADPDDYRLLSDNWVRHGVFGHGVQPTAYRPPLYPGALAALRWSGATTNAAVAALHLTLGLGTVLLTVLAGQLMGVGRASAVAGALVACDPILLNQSTLVMTETLATFLAAAALALLAATVSTATVDRPAWRSTLTALGAGIALGLASLCRPTFLIWLALAPAATMWLVPVWRAKWRLGVAMGVASLLTLAPWTARNLRQFGAPIVATTHGGYTLLLANNPEFYEFLGNGAPGGVWDAAEFNERIAAERKAQLTDSERDHDRREANEAWQCIRLQPTACARAACYRVARLWGAMPRDLGDAARGGAMRAMVAAFYVFEFALAAVGLWTLGRKLYRCAWLYAVLLAASFTAVHAFYWTDMRMRAPLAPAVALAAAVGAAKARAAWSRVTDWLQRGCVTGSGP